jgi:HEAT repeat protein
MAVAFALGVRIPGEDDSEAAKLLVKLLESQSERVRFRAASAIENRAKWSDTSDKARDIMLMGAREVKRMEKSDVVTKALADALEVL